jgi:outer membrane protein TolC
LNIGQLTEIAVRNRPELGQFNQSRLAAVRQIQVQMANLMPTAQFFLSANRNQTERGGSAGGGAATGGANLGSLIGTGASGNGVGGSSVVGVGAGGIGGSATGATTVIPAGGGGGAGIAVGGGGNNTNTSESFTMGFDINWNLQGLGVPDAMTTMSQRYLARQAMLQYNQTAINVLTQVRSSYLNTLTAEEQVDVTGEAVIAGREGLRLANLRLQHGVGTNLELIQAQRDYITALINQAQAIINFNISQAQLLHDIGQISLATLTTEINRPISHDPLQSKFFDPAKHSIN